MTQNLLSSLAFLKIHSDTTNDIFLDNFIPFAVQSLKQLKENVVSITDLQDQLLRDFGIRIPQSVIKAILYRAKKEGGYVRLEDKVFYKVNENINSFVFSSVQEKVERVYAALINNFIEYSNSKFGVPFSEEEAEQALLSFIGYNQPYFYRSQTDESIISIRPLSSDDKKYIVASYIYEARQSKPEIYDYLDTVVKGYMIANVLYLPDVHDTKKKFHKTTVYLDTSFIIHALGYNGEQIKLPRLELLELLYKNNAKIRCFEHTVEEIEGILQACSQNLKDTTDTPFGRSVRYFVSMGYSPSDVKLLISHLRGSIQKLRIEIVPIPKYENHSYVIDEDALFKYLKSKIRYNREDAAHKDVASISAIYRLRKNNYSAYLELSNAVFVTTNNTLTSVSNDFFYQTNDNGIAPPCVTDFFLTNLLWLKTPNQAPDLPMKKIIADSYAAIQPDEKLMSKWINEIKRLEAGEPITPEDYYFMRSSDEIYLALMEITRGDDDAITSGTVPQILERAKEIVRRDVEQKYQSEHDKRVETESAMSYLRAEGVRRETERRNRLHERSLSFAKIAVKIFRIMVFLLLILGVFLTLPLNFIFSDQVVANIFSNLPQFVLPLCFFIMLVIGVWGQYYGTTINSWLNSLEVAIEKQIYKLLWSISS